MINYTKLIVSDKMIDEIKAEGKSENEQENIYQLGYLKNRLIIFLIILHLKREIDGAGLLILR